MVKNKEKLSTNKIAELIFITRTVLIENYEKETI